MKKVLLISYFFPPITAVGGGVIRVLKFVKYLPNFGIKPYILTARNPFLPVDETLIDDIPQEACVYRIPQIDPRYIFSGGAKANQNLNNGHKTVAEASCAFKELFKFFAFPDTAWPWIIPALSRGLALVKKEKIETICVSAPPFSCIIIGYLIKKFTRLPLIIDYRDLMSVGRKTHNVIWIFHFLRERIERFILKRADAVIVTCEGAKEALVSETGSSIKKFHVITNGFDRQDICAEKISSGKNDTFEIFYAGYLYAERTPFVFFEAVKELIEERVLKKKVLIKLIGRVDREVAENNCFKSLLKSGNLIIEDSHPYRQTLKILEGADVLLVTSDLDVNCMLPGKLFEYMALGKPILAVGQKDSELFSFVDRLKLGVCADMASKNSVKFAISGLIEITNLSEVYPALNSEMLAPYERKQLVKKLAEIILGTET